MPRSLATPWLALMPVFAVYALVSILRHQGMSHDEASFIGFARNLTHGFYAQTHSSNPVRYLWHGPTLPALLVPLVALDLPLEVIRLFTSALVLFLLACVFHRMVREYLRPGPALLVAYGVALYLPFIQVNGVYAEPVATLSLTLVAFFAVRAFRGGRRDQIWAGVALGALAMARAEFGYVLAATLVLSVAWLLVARRSLMARRSAVASLVALLVCMPWLLYTYSLSHRVFYWGNSGGQSLYWMTAPGNLGDWHGPADAYRYPQLAASRPVFTQLSRLKPLDQDARLQHIAWQNIGRHPGHYLTNVVNNIDRLVFNSPYSFTNEKASSMLYAVPNALLLGLLAIAGFVAVRVRRSLAPELAPLAAFALLGFLVHVPLAAYARFVIPLVPLLVWLVVAVLARPGAARAYLAAF